MQKHSIVVIAATACALFLLVVAPAQALQGPPSISDFDARDFSGIWAGAQGDRSISAQAPPFTAEGAARFKQNVPSRDRNPELAAGIDINASNDPTFECNPRGFPRILYDTNVRIHEFVHLNGRILQLLQRERTLRELWMDGRSLPTPENVENLGPSWMGHSVAHWEGDTLVVNTVGLDDRAWIDFFGYPKSFEARVEERWKRVDRETMELQLTLHDPKYYTAPWVSDTKIFRLEPKERLTFFGWFGMYSGVTELMCAPMNANPINKRGG
jgi:hypothetical protein